MVFSSVIFLFSFLPIFLICYYVAPQRMKNVILFLGSLFFYAWGEPIYIFLMLFSTISDYIHGLLISRCRRKRNARFFLISSIVINLGVLGFFKYADFVIQSINGIAGTSIPLLNLPLPIGISFYTFQTMSYTIDVYRKETKVQKNLLDFAVFVTMFPQLIAGPIVKYRQVADKLHDRKVDVYAVSYGLRRFVVGFAKKVLIANNTGLLWTEISSMDLGEMKALTAWLGIVAYAFQIYFDFSGYSDMAIGLGSMLGFDFPENFNYPYIASSITEFWRRWHISLSSWFKEYVYIPLGGNRKGIKRQLLNILIVWALTGIWHGAGWNFLCWGMWFALFLILEKLFLGKVLSYLPKMIGRWYMFAVVLVSWVFFEVPNIDQIQQYLMAMFGMNGAGLIDGYMFYLLKGNAVLLIISAIGSTPIFARIAKKMRDSQKGPILALYGVLEKVILPVLLLLSIAYMVEASYNPFLYFRF